MEDLGLLPQGEVQDPHEQQQQQKKRKKNDEDATMQAGRSGDAGRESDTERDGDGNGSGLPWLERLIRGSQLGRISRHRNHPHHRHRLTHETGHDTDGRARVEWEVLEWTDESHHHHPSSDGNTAVVVVGGGSVGAGAGGDASTKRSIDLVDHRGAGAEKKNDSSAATKGEDVEMQ